MNLFYSDYLFYFQFTLHYHIYYLVMILFIYNNTKYTIHYHLSINIILNNI